MEKYEDLIKNRMFISAICQELSKEICVWGDPARLKIHETAGMVNTLFNTNSGTVTVGAYTFTGHNVCILTGTHDVEQHAEERMCNYPTEGRDIVIGSGVWIASNATILGPCVIGDNAVVAAGAVVVPGTTIPPDLVWGNVPAKPLKGRSEEGDSRMDEVKQEVNVEKIMEKIWEQIRREEGMAEIPSFEEIPARGEAPVGPPTGNLTEAECEKDWPLLLASLQYVNNGYDIPYYWSFGPHSVKTFAKRIVRKLLKCLIAPILAMQNSFNAHTVRCLNQLRYFVESILTRLDEDQRELEELRQYVLRQDEEIHELEELRQQILRQNQEIHEIEEQYHEQLHAALHEIQAAQEREHMILDKIAVQETLIQKEVAEASQLYATGQENLDKLRQDIFEAIERVNTQYQDVTGELGTEKEHIQRWQNDRDRKIQAIARDVVRTKWAFTDYMEDLRNADGDIVQCGICGYSGETTKLEKRVTTCIFDGGELVRYVCPECGAIFGPTKFSSLSKDARNDDYTVHYTGYHEGDSTDKEVKTFMRLEPSKDGVYLNYGCGSWSQTMRKLHDLGYCVYGFEPYSQDIENPYIISDRAILSKMRFNGIFSNDVLEHLMDPAAELSFMKTLLATPDAKMAHTTGCYDYKYEYTRFHVYFFTGRALDVLCEKAGLNLLEISDAESAVGEKDFHCRIFEMKEEEIDYLSLAFVNQFAQRKKEGYIELSSDGMCFGPYVRLPKGEYLLDIHVEIPKNIRHIGMKVTSHSGRQILTAIDLRNGDNAVCFSLEHAEEDLEFVIENNTEDNIILKKLAMKR